MRRAMMVLAVLASALLGLGCGGGGTYSCDVTSGTAHGCTEYTWTGTYDTAAWGTACTSNGGKAGTGCSHTNAVGGCKLTATSGGNTVSTTTWYYSGTASTYQSACTTAGGTFQNP